MVTFRTSELKWSAAQSLSYEAFVTGFREAATEFSKKIVQFKNL